MGSHWIYDMVDSFSDLNWLVDWLPSQSDSSLIEQVITLMFKACFTTIISPISIVFMKEKTQVAENWKHNNIISIIVVVVVMVDNILVTKHLTC